VNSGGSLFHRFTFNKIYPPKTEQEEVFNNMVLPKLKEFFEGRNQVSMSLNFSSCKSFTLLREGGRE
jgi:hypothetical protein